MQVLGGIALGEILDLGMWLVGATTVIKGVYNFGRK